MVRHLAPPFLLAVALAALTGWLGMAGGFVWSDYEYANVEPFGAIAAGDWSTFFHTAPIEGPSLLLRAPFAMLPSLWGGGEEAIYRTVAVPGLLAGAVLGTLLRHFRLRDLPGAQHGWIVIVLAAANPITYRALEIGHPEELMGAVLCIGAVLVALRDRPVLAGVLLGLAVANKAWAVLAVAPVLLALGGGRLRALVTAGVVGGVFVLPFLLDAESRSAIAQAGSTDAVFQPWQLFWPLGDFSDQVRGFDGNIKDDWRAAPAYIGAITHPLIVLLAVPAALYWRRRRGTERSEDLLLLLALLFLQRCILDVANNVYYHLPFILTLLTWEALRFRQPPLLTVLATAATWCTFEVAPDWLSPDGQYLLYVAISVPAFAALFCLTYRIAPPLPGRRVAAAAPR